MDLSPHAVSAASFPTVKKGWDPEEVRAFLTRVAGSLEASQQHATAMEARARAAIAKLQDLTQQQGAAPASATSPAVPNAPDEAESISRALLLAQRTADLTVADARAEAEALRESAAADAATILEQARATADQLVEDARVEGRRAHDAERERAGNEVQALLARRDFLVGDVEHLEQHVAAERERVRAVAAALVEIADRTPAGLAEVRRPLLSASADDAEPAPAPGSHGGDAGGPDAAGVAGADEPQAFSVDGGDPDDEAIDRTPLAGELPLGGGELR